MEQFSLEKYLADSTRKVITRDGREVRILCVDRNDPVYPIVTLVKSDKKDNIVEYTTKGEYIIGKFGTDTRDLFFVPQKQSRWVFMKRSLKGDIYSSQAYKSKDKAEFAMKQEPQGFALTEITWEE